MNNFYDDSKPLFNPENVMDKVDYVCDTVVSAFSRHVIEHALEKYEHEEIGHVGSCNGNTPVYYLKELNILVYMSPVSSTMAGTMLQEVAYLTGATKFIFFGSCGILDRKYKGKIIVPKLAYRDEGLSYHYMPASESIDIKNYGVVEAILKDNQLDYIVGNTWSTDGIYRETVNKIEKYRNEGCVCVEMEASGLQAVSNYLNINYYTFFLTGDLLEQEWSREDLGGFKEKHKQISSFDIALLIAKNIKD